MQKAMTREWLCGKNMVSSLIITDAKHIYCIRCYGSMGRHPLAHEPENIARGIAEHKLALTLEIVALAVSEVVAHQFTAIHAIRRESVSRLHRTDGEGKLYPISIESGDMGMATDIMRTRIGGSLETDGKPVISIAVVATLRQEYCGQWGYGFANNEGATIHSQKVGVGLPYLTRLGSRERRKNLLNLNRVEA